MSVMSLGDCLRMTHIMKIESAQPVACIIGVDKAVGSQGLNFVY